MIPVPSAPGQDPRPFYLALVEAIEQLQRPGSPTQAYSASSSDLPAPSDWPNCMVLVTDLKILAVSDGAHWIRQDTGAAI